MRTSFGNELTVVCEAIRMFRFEQLGRGGCAARCYVVKIVQLMPGIVSIRAVSDIARRRRGFSITNRSHAGRKSNNEKSLLDATPADC
jgi:hypothetical protein